MLNEKRPWITDFAEADTNVTSLLKRFQSTDNYAVAYYTDAFQSGWASKLLPIDEDSLEKLMELRVFNEKEELWLHRSCLGGPFAWRVASEKALTEPKRYCFETRQLIDLGESPSVAPAFNAEGLRVLKTISGRSFRLPITAEERYVRIMNYVDYDEKGVANTADWRLVGFAAAEMEVH